MSNSGNNNVSGGQQEIVAGPHSSQQNSQQGKYVPPHLRGRPETAREQPREREPQQHFDEPRGGAGYDGHDDRFSRGGFGGGGGGYSDDRYGGSRGGGGFGGRGGFGGGGGGGFSRGGSSGMRGGFGGGGGGTAPPRNERWQDSAPPRRGPTMARDDLIESELFAAQTTGINFDKYNDIPVEASGNDVPAPVRKLLPLKSCLLLPVTLNEEPLLCVDSSLLFVSCILQPLLHLFPPSLPLFSIFFFFLSFLPFLHFFLPFFPSFLLSFCLFISIVFIFLSPVLSFLFLLPYFLCPSLYADDPLLSCLPPESFEELIMHEVLKSNVKLAGYQAPTPIQVGDKVVNNPMRIHCSHEQKE
jgi:hypothetical protein